MKCPHCQFENPPTVKFCGECGTKLALICPRCRAENPPAFKFCGECGAALAAPAAAPAAPARPPTLEAQFATLQRALPASVREQLLTPGDGENRLVTVLFADLSGSVAQTAHLAAEEAAALVNRLLTAMVDALQRYDGRVDRFLGDGVLAAFGTPQAHENDPERAILAALAIRRAAEELGLDVTAGINTGEVYFGGMGSERHQELTVMGPAVNLAARLQGKAQPGQILVGEATYRHTRRAFAFEPLVLEVKGLSQPVIAHAVGRPLPRPEKVRGIEGLRAELIGREAELARLQDTLAEVLRGRGQMVSIIGEAGVGKSRLVAELKGLALADLTPSPFPEGQGSTSGNSGAAPSSPAVKEGGQEVRSSLLWLEGCCLSLGLAASYWPFLDLLQQYFGFAPEDDDRARGERLAAGLRRLVDAGDLPADRFEELGPLLGHALSIRFGNEWDDRLQHADPQQLKHRTFLAVRDFLLALARRQPVVVVLEDLHWADSLSIDLVSLLLESLTLAPLLLVCVYRPEREHKCWHLGTIAARKCPERYTEIVLRELTPAQSGRLVAALLRIEDLPAAVQELILARAQGNPFFVEEVVRSLIEAGVVYRDGEVWRARPGIAAVAVPESVQAVILSRVDRLEREVKQVLQAAAVIGRLFRRRVLARVLAQAEALDRALWELEDRALVYEERAVPEAEYSFQHVLTQETVYQSLLRRRRVGFHRQVGEALEALYAASLDEHYEQLAYHYERSDAAEKAIAYLLKAGEKARRAYLNEEAIGYFQRARERLDALDANTEHRTPNAAHLEWRLAALQGLGWIHLGVGNVAEAASRFREAIALGRDVGVAPRQLVRLYFGLGEALHWLRQWDERLRIGEEGLALLGDDVVSVEAALMNGTIAIAHGAKGNWQEYRDFTLRNAQFVRRLAYAEELRAIYTHIFSLYAYFEGNEQEARSWLDHLEALAQQHHDVRAWGSVHHFRGSFLSSTSDPRGAIAHYQRAMELYQAIGDANHETDCLRRTASAYATLGDHENAAAWAERALEVADRFQNKAQMAESHTLLGSILIGKGDLREAASQYERALTIQREMGDKRGTAVTLNSWGEGRRLQGDYAAARKLYEKSLTIWQELGNKVGTATALNNLGIVALEEGDAAVARSALTQALALYRQLGIRRLGGETLAALGGVAARAGDAARAAPGSWLPPTDEAIVLAALHNGAGRRAPESGGRRRGRGTGSACVQASGDVPPRRRAAGEGPGSADGIGGGLTNHREAKGVGHGRAADGDGHLPVHRH